MSCLAVLLLPNGSLAEKEENIPKVTPVFEVQNLFESVRIPNILVATDGTVLAFAKSGQLLRRSEDSIILRQSGFVFAGVAEGQCQLFADQKDRIA